MLAERNHLIGIGGLPLGDDLPREMAGSKVGAGQHNHFENGVFADLKTDVKKSVAKLNDRGTGNEENGVKHMGHRIAPDSKTREPGLCAAWIINISQQSPRAALFAPATGAGDGQSLRATLSQQARTASQ